MQRIDENTYIDDTLVTCAEYQLFIDEMRERGKYYQPDHWTSYQFPEGQAREPILGVRHSDAGAFCAWLTNRDASEWNYHLPTEENAEQFPKKASDQRQLGYWLNVEHKFAWVIPVPNNIRGINREHIHGRVLVFTRAQYGHIEGLFASNRARNIDRDLDRARALDQAVDPAHERAGVCALDLARVRDFADSLGLITYDLDVALTRYLAIDLNFDKELNSALLHALYEVNERDLALDIYIDIFTLLERMAGRSPAFEGIRLVKERIR